MNTTITYSILLIALGYMSHHPSFNYISDKELKYLYKTKLIIDADNYGQHIAVRQPPATSVAENFESLIDDRDIIAGLKFSKQMKIEMLKEFLTFQKDTIRSNKFYYLKTPGGYSNKWTIPDVKNFTIEIEALYSFTKMLTTGVPPIVPVLIERQTGAQINGCREKVDKVYEIYRKWLTKNRKSGFKNMKLPLVGTPYGWLGDDDGLESFLKDTL